MPISKDKKELRGDRVKLQQAIGEFKRAETPTQKTAATDLILKVVLKNTGQNLKDDDGDNGRERFASVVANLNPGQVLGIGISEAVKSNLEQTGKPFDVPEVVLKRLDKLV